MAREGVSLNVGLIFGDFRTTGLSAFLIFGSEVAGLALKISKLIAVTVFFSTAGDTRGVTTAGEIGFEVDTFAVLSAAFFPTETVAAGTPETATLDLTPALESFSFFIC